MEYLVDALYTLIAIPIAWVFKLAISKVSMRGRYLWMAITAILVILSFFSIIFLYSVDIGKEWHRGIQLSFLLSAIFTYHRIEPLSVSYEKPGNNVNENIEHYKAYMKARRENKQWWQFWL